MTIGEKIFELRKEKGVSQETMAFELNVSRQAVSKWETDQSIPDLDKIKALAEYFNVSIDYIVNDICYNEEIIKATEVNLNKYNIVKRYLKLMLKTVIGLNILYFVYILSCVLFQAILMKFYHGKEMVIFIIPWFKILNYTLFNGTQILLSFMMLKQLGEDSKKYKDKIVYLSIYVLAGFLINSLIKYFESEYITSLPGEVASYYLLFNQLLNEYLVSIVFNTLFFVSLILMIIVRYNDSSRYKLPLNKKEYKASDSVLSFLNGLFLAIPGLIFQIFWCLDAKSDNDLRFKKMRFWYIIGFIVSVLVYIILLIIDNLI